MKIIRPKQPIKNVAKETVIVGNEIITQEYRAGIDENGVMCQERRVISKEPLIDDNTVKDQTIENLMDEVIAEKTILLNDKWQVTVYFTERQYNLWKKKGGEKWLKRALVGVKTGKKKKK